MILNVQVFNCKFSILKPNYGNRIERNQITHQVSCMVHYIIYCMIDICNILVQMSDQFLNYHVQVYVSDI